MIPRIIHQTWKDNSIPEPYQEYYDSWKRHHPDWEFRLWTDEDNLRLVEEDYPWLTETYQAYPFVIQRTDMARILYLHKYGGLYIDLDFECLKPLNDLFESHRIVLGREYLGGGHYFSDHDFACNALMASTPGHPFWEMLLKRMVHQFRPYRPWNYMVWYVLSTTGPRVLDTVVQEYLRDNDDLIVHPREFFYATPYSEQRPTERRRIAKQVDSYAIHHYGGSWLTLTQRCMRTAENWFSRMTRLFRREKRIAAADVEVRPSNEADHPHSK